MILVSNVEFDAFFAEEMEAVLNDSWLIHNAHTKITSKFLNQALGIWKRFILKIRSNFFYISDFGSNFQFYLVMDVVIIVIDHFSGIVVMV